MSDWWKNKLYDSIHIDHTLNDNSIVVELGGYHGTWIDKIIKKYNPYVYILEPVKEFYNILHNKFHNNNKIKIYNVGITNDTKSDILILNKDKTSKYIDNKNSQYSTEECSFWSPNKFLELINTEYSIKTQVDLLQINIEGEEYNLLNYLIDTNLIYRFKKIIIEFHTCINDHQELRLQIQNRLLNKGYIKNWDYPFIFECWELIQYPEIKLLTKQILDIVYNSKEGHIPSSLSVLDILFAFYNINNNNQFILSKGHASLALYVILNYFGLLNEDLNGFCKFNSKLGGHPSNDIQNIFVSTGSLGHGLPIGVGMAIGNKIKQNTINTYVLIGDGESNEGTIWESSLLASHHNLNNLYCIMDYNHSGDRALKIDNIINKFKAFNWEVLEINGHHYNEISIALNYKSNDKPIFILANTIKGHGINIMENNPEWHHKIPTIEEYNNIIDQL